MTPDHTKALFCALMVCVLPDAPLASPGPIAEIICAPSAEMRLRLERQFQSRRVWQGLRNPDEIMELWEGPQGDWTLVISRTSGSVCIVAMGTQVLGFADVTQS